MAKRGAPLGNKNASKGKPITDRLTKLCVQEDWSRLEQALGKMLDQAADGDQRALTFIAERLEGRPTQVLAGDSENPLGLVGILTQVNEPETPSETSEWIKRVLAEEGDKKDTH